MQEHRIMPRPERLITAEELLTMPDDGKTYELVEGRLVEMSETGSLHGVLIVRLAVLLHQHVAANRLGVLAANIGVILARNPDTVRGPDIAFIRRERVPAAGIPEGFWPGPPDLVIEIRSPGERPAEIRGKLSDYLARGVRAVWIVDPKKRTVTVHQPFSPVATLRVDDTLDGGDVVPGFTCTISGLFE
jgi:Uma2 family endonuclease